MRFPHFFLVPSFVGATLVSGFSASEPLPLDPQQSLAAHNLVRNMLNAGLYPQQPVPDPGLSQMMWDQDLATSAQTHADSCRWQHSTDRVNTGENLYATTSPAVDIEAAVSAWAEEHEFYSFENNSCQPGQQCGHYTQLVWDDSISVGCAAARCAPLVGANGNTVFSSSVVTVCQYKMAGNYIGVRPYDTDGFNQSFSTYSGATRQLDIPYFLVRYPDNLVIAYSVRMQLTGTDPILFTVTELNQIGYWERDHVASYDVHTGRLFLPHVMVINDNVSSHHSAVLELVAGDGINLQLISFD